jgi:chorismate lyase/3-hydroxybenzoate synthase
MSLAWRPETAAPALARVDLVDAGDAGRPPLPFLEGSLRTETWLAQEPPTRGELHGLRYAAAGEVCFARLAPVDDGDAADTAADAYRRLLALQDALDYPHLLRVWHFLGEINAGEGDAETYKRFCVGRARALEDRPRTLNRLPAATVVGTATPGLELHALLSRRPPQPIENPRQISAVAYPREYGPRQPIFARAAVIDWNHHPQLFVSGTASIVGHATRHAGDAAAQFRESLANVDSVLQAAAPLTGPLDRAALDCLKVYLRRAQDLPAVAAEVATALRPDLPVAYLRADLCRRDLLVELETQVTRPRPGGPTSDPSAG